MSKKVSKKVEIISALVLLALFVVPFLMFAGSKDIYVDIDASGRQDGSKKHPYKTIAKALDKVDEDDKVHVAAGTYEENILIPEKVELYGEDRTKVIIKADDDDYETVDMDHGAKINGVTVRGGEYGIRVGKNARASIVNCIVKDNEQDGILVEKGDIDDKKKVSISDSLITENGRAGIYSAKRRLVLIYNEITHNDSDGVDIEAGSSVYINKNKIKDNDGSGLKLTLDGSYIWTDDNSFSENKREGVEIESYGGAGTINIRDDRIHDNDRYGIARVQRSSFESNPWGGLVLEKDNMFYENNKGKVSDIIHIR